MKIALLGSSGVGKSSIAELLSKKLGLQWFDTDKIFIAKYGAIEDYFKDDKEKFFRKKEKEILCSLLDLDDIVVSLGGGLGAIEKLKKEYLCDFFVFWLYASNDIIWKRLELSYKRPLIQTKEDMIFLNKKRHELFRSNSDFMIDTNDVGVESIVDKIIDIIERIMNKT